MPDELAGKSVAIQGLPALEYLLYGDGAEALAGGSVGGEQSPPEIDTETAFRCGFANAVDCFAEILVRVSGAGHLYQTDRERFIAACAG